MWEAAAQYFWWAERFGWTPAQVDMLPLMVRDRMPGVARMYDEVQEERQKRNSK